MDHRSFYPVQRGVSDYFPCAMSVLLYCPQYDWLALVPVMSKFFGGVSLVGRGWPKGKVLEGLEPATDSHVMLLWLTPKLEISPLSLIILTPPQR